MSFHLTDADWLQIVTASVYTVLSKRDDALPKAKRLMVDVCQGGLAAVANARESGPPERIAFLQHIRECVVSSVESEKCFDAAIASCQDEWVTPIGGSCCCCCCISGLTTDLLQVTLFGNKGPGRTESVHVVNSEWKSFVQGLMVVGSLHEMLDQLLLDLASTPPEHRTMSTEEIATLAQVTLKQQRLSVNRAAACIATFVS